MDSFPGSAAPKPQNAPAGLIQGPQLWWASTPAIDEEAVLNPQVREAESAARPGLLRPDPWR
jgi:hypothetical protein